MSDTLIRGCDVRKWGKTYIKNYIVDDEIVYNVPIEKLLCCPPWKVNMKELDMTYQGMRIIERVDMFGNGTGIYDLWDYVSHTAYPYAADFVEEGRRFGFSRLISEMTLRSAEFKLLVPDVSEHVLVHDRALLTLESAMKLQEHRLNLHVCPADNPRHKDMQPDTVEPCFALTYECIETSSSPKTPREWYVPMPRIPNPTFAYKGATALKEWDIEFDGPAAFMFLPLSKAQLEVIEDPLEHKEVDALQLLADIEAQFPYKMMKE